MIVFTDMLGKDVGRVPPDGKGMLVYGILNRSHQREAEVNFSSVAKRGGIIFRDSVGDKSRGACSLTGFEIPELKVTDKWFFHALRVEVNDPNVPQEVFLTTPTVEEYRSRPRGRVTDNLKPMYNIVTIFNLAPPPPPPPSSPPRPHTVINEEETDKVKERPTISSPPEKVSLMNLSGAQFQQLSAALRDAFRDPAALSQMLRYKLNYNLYDLALGNNLQEIAHTLIETTEAQGWTLKLIAAAREYNPGNPKLLALAEQFGLAPAIYIRQDDSIVPVLSTTTKLELTIKQSNSFLPVERWRTQLGEVEAQVCRIEIKASGKMKSGTGFLLGSSIVMTNYHVMESVIKGTGAKPEEVVLRFDYKQASDGVTINPGTTYKLESDDWLVSSSPAGELDYALLRVAGAPGHEPIGGGEADALAAPPRRWVRMIADDYDFPEGSALFILQHPLGGPLKLALDTEAIVGLSPDGSRVRYKTNTEPGSSGSPCFNSNWELVALHCGAGASLTPAYNEGVPFAAILAHLEQRGSKDALDT